MADVPPDPWPPLADYPELAKAMGYTEGGATRVIKENLRRNMHQFADKARVTREAGWDGIWSFALFGPDNVPDDWVTRIIRMCEVGALEVADAMPSSRVDGLWFKTEGASLEELWGAYEAITRLEAQADCDHAAGAIGVLGKPHCKLCGVALFRR